MANQPGSVIHVTRCHTFFWPNGSTVFGGEVGVTVPDYVAIGILVVLIVWAVADWIPRGKL